MWYFMHLGDEKKKLYVFYHNTFDNTDSLFGSLLLIEGGYLHDTLSPLVNWKY